jgi:beta-phosphoglucomutase-like phosphatase (HAD superfamily)
LEHLLIRAIIFDFDGLIVDTETSDYQSWQEIYQSYGCDLPLAHWTASIGRGSDDISFDPYESLEAQLKRPIDRAVVKMVRRRRKMDMVVTQPILPGVERYITDAKRLGLKIGLASSSGGEWVKGHLTRFGI